MLGEGDILLCQAVAGIAKHHLDGGVGFGRAGHRAVQSVDALADDRIIQIRKALGDDHLLVDMEELVEHACAGRLGVFLEADDRTEAVILGREGFEPDDTVADRGAPRGKDLVERCGREPEGPPAKAVQQRIEKLALLGIPDAIRSLDIDQPARAIDLHRGHQARTASSSLAVSASSLLRRSVLPPSNVRSFPAFERRETTGRMMALR